MPRSVISERQCPAIQFKEKCSITLVEHQAIVAREENPERKKLYQLCWHLGGSQGDIANLRAEDVDWKNRTISFNRQKTGVPVILHLGDEALNTLKDLPSEGLLSDIREALTTPVRERYGDVNAEDRRGLPFPAKFAGPVIHDPQIPR